MDFIKISFGRPVSGFTADLGKTLEHLFTGVGPRFPLARDWRPQMDIYEIPGGVLLVAELAGVDPENLTVEISSDAVHLSGFRRDFPKGPDVRFHLAEIAYGRFERVVYLPVAVDPEAATASFENGFLRLTLAAAKSAGPYRVEVRSL